MDHGQFAPFKSGGFFTAIGVLVCMIIGLLAVFGFMGLVGLGWHTLMGWL